MSPYSRLAARRNRPATSSAASRRAASKAAKNPKSVRPAGLYGRALRVERLEDRRLLDAGALDLSFGDGDGLVLGPVGVARSVALQADGKVVVAGSVSNQFFVARYNADGTLDTSFGGDGFETTAIGSKANVHGVAIQADGKIVAAGFSRNGSNDDFALARYNADGSLDTTFSGDGIQTTNIGYNDQAYDVAIRADGTIVLAGSSYGDGNHDFTLLRYNADGSLDATFGGDGVVTTAIGTSHDFAYGVAIQADGKIVAAGQTYNGSNDDFAVARYNADGSLDVSFGGDGVATTTMGTNNDFAYSVAIQADGKVVAAGFSSDGSNYDFALTRYNADGSLDASFGGDGVVTTTMGTSNDFAYGVAIQADGRIVAAGYSLNGSNDDVALARYNADGSLDTSFGGDGVVTTAIGTGPDRARDVAIQADGKIVAAGVSGTQVALIRYDLTRPPVVTDPVGSEASDEDPPYTLDEAALLAGASDPDGDPLHLAGLTHQSGDAAGVTIAGNTLLVNPAAYSALSVGQSVEIVYGYRVVDTLGASVDQTVRITITGANHPPVVPARPGFLDESFGDGGTAVSGIDGYTTAMAVDAAGRMVVAGYTTDGDFALARHNADGSIDASFGAGGVVTTDFDESYDCAYAVAVQADGKIVAAGSRYRDGDNDFAVARYNADGSLDTTFGVGGRSTVDVASAEETAFALTIQGDGRIVLAGYSYLEASSYDFALARFNADGSLDTSFDLDGRVLTDIGAEEAAFGVAIQADGRIVASGTSRGDEGELFAVARYNGDGSLDSGWGGAGTVTATLDWTDHGYSVAVQADGRIVVAGEIADDEDYGFGLMRFNADGTLDMAFGGDGKVVYHGDWYPAYGRDVALQTDGKIVVAGMAYDSLADGWCLALARFLPDGTPDAAFGYGGHTMTGASSWYDEMVSLSIQADGKLVVAGGYSGESIFLARFDVTGQAVAASASEDDEAFSVDLLAGASDPDGEELHVDNLQAVRGDNSGVTLVDNRLWVDPTVYSYLAAGEFVVVFCTYDVVDEHDGRAGQSAAIVISGVNHAPTAGEPLLAAFSQDDPDVYYGYWDLVAGSTDPDEDELFVARLRILSGDGRGIELEDQSFSFDPAAYRHLAEGAEERIVVGYEVVDAYGGAAEQTLTINVSGTNDAPERRYRDLLDPSFGAGGQVTTDFDATYDLAFDLALQADGRIVVVGCSGPDDGYDDIALARYNVDGSLDANFGDGGRVTTDLGLDEAATAVALQADGRIVIVGERDELSIIVRYNSDGSLDAGFGEGGVVVAGEGIEFRDLTLQADGKIVVVGQDWYGDVVVARFGTDGAPDATFGSLGSVTLVLPDSAEEANAVAIQSDGAIVVAGAIYADYRTGYDFALARLNPDGSLDASFGVGGLMKTAFGGSAYDTAYSLAILSGGRIVLAGESDQNGSTDFALACYLADGTLDPAFGTGGLATANFADWSYDAARGVAVQADGKIVLAGFGGNEQSHFALARFDANGAPDATFGDGGRLWTTFDGGDSLGRAVAIQADGRIVVAGYSGRGRGEFALARYDTTLPTEDADAFEVDLFARASDPDGDPLTVENFSVVEGDAGGLAFDGGSLLVTPAAYNYLAAGEWATIEFACDVVDPHGERLTLVGQVHIAGLNDAPMVAGGVVSTASEDAAGYNVDLLAGASDADGDPLSVVDFALVSGNAAGITLAGNSLLVTPAAYNWLAAGAEAVVEFGYKVSDGHGGSVAQTARVTITGVNDAPTLAAIVTSTGSEDAAGYNVDLLAGASDAESDPLSVVDFALTSGNAAGISRVGNTLLVTPAAYNALAAGASAVIEFGYKVSDGHGGSVAQTARVTITGVNDAPTLAGPLTREATVEDPEFTLDLLVGAADPEGGTLAVNELALASGNNAGITVLPSGNGLVVNPAAYAGLDADVVVVYQYQIVDPQGEWVAQTATLTIGSLNDEPTVSGSVAKTASEDAAGFSVNLLEGASDADGDPLSIANLIHLGGYDIGAWIDGTHVVVNPAAYGYLSAGSELVLSYRYDIVDGNGGSVAQTATITINGVNDAPAISAHLFYAGHEDAAAYPASLLAGAGDPDGDPLHTADLVWLGDTQGTTLAGDTVAVDGSGYDYLAAGQQTYVTIFYNVLDPHGGSVAQTAFISFFGVNDAPTVGSALYFAGGEDDAPFSANLLAGASDADNGATLAVTGLAIISGDAAGMTLAGNVVMVDPTAYNYLTAGQWNTVEYQYTVDDGLGGAAVQTAYITIIGVNDAPTAGADAASVNLGQAVAIDVLANDTDPDRAAGSPANAGLTVVGVGTAGSGSVSINSDGTVRYAPFAALEAGGSDSFVYTVQDAAGATATGTVTMTLVQAAGVGTIARDGNLLRIGGTDRADTYNLTSSGGMLRRNGANTGISLLGVTEIHVWARGGNDRVDLRTLGLPAFVHGGGGNDTLLGGNARNIFLGGAGADQLTGNSEADLLVGGGGADRLSAGAGHDILFAGDVDFRTSLLDLEQMLAGWVAAQASRPPADVFVSAVDDALDRLAGGTGNDRYVAAASDIFGGFDA